MLLRSAVNQAAYFAMGVLAAISLVIVVGYQNTAYGQNEPNRILPASEAQEQSAIGRVEVAATAAEKSEQPLVEAGLIEIKTPFTSAVLAGVRRQIDRAIEQGVGTIVFRFSGRGRSFDSFSDLARDIAHLPERKHVRTVAYVPKEALGMTMLAVFACREVIADDFADLGEVMPPADVLRKWKETSPSLSYDQQRVVSKITSFARAAGHNPLLARAMTEKRMILYRIERAEETKLVDQRGFEEFTQRSEPAWRMAGAGPLVGSDEVLLLDGREAFDLKLVTHLAADEDELVGILGVKPADLSPASKVTKAEEPNDSVLKPAVKKAFKADISPKAAVITCSEMIDQGLYESIKRRAEIALADGATHIILEIDTFGGRVDSAIAIWDYLMHDLADKAHTVAYIPTKAISAGALISVACRDIIMKRATKIGDCAPVSLGGKLEGVEREKMESPLRSYFDDAANINGYPAALCRAMVTVDLEIYQVKNIETGQNEYFETSDLPTDYYKYDLEGKKIVIKKGELLTFTADQAYEHGLARAVVEDREGAVAFLEKRDKLQFPKPIAVLETNWSEGLVRWITSPTVAGILLMIAMLGIYAELNSPGLGLPGAVAIIALAILFGSKFLIGMANWWEIAIFVIGMGLLVLEIFIIPGFGIAGISGIFLILFALAAMMVQNKPEEFPLPSSPVDWVVFEQHLIWMIVSFFGFLICAYFLGRYFPKLPVTSRLILQAQAAPAVVREGGKPGPAPEIPVRIGQEGVALTQLRPSGTARFGSLRVDVVSRGAIIEAKRKISIVEIQGNSIVVKEIPEQNDYT